MSKKKSGPVVYVGPDIKGVANQYTVYSAGLPESLSKKAGEIPAINGLILPLEQLPDAIKKLNGGYGHIYALYRKVQAKL